MGDSISDIFNNGLGQFSRILTSGVLHSMESDVPHTLWEDELGRLRVWAANIGAHKKDQSSLDYRLRDASPVKEQTIRLLQGLRELFDDLEEVLAEPAPEDNSADDEFDGLTELQQMHGAIVDNITCLYQMSMAIRRPAQHDRILGTLKEDAFVFEFFDRQHVSNKFPRAEPTVIERLGAAISRRRAAFRYRERHHAKLGQGIHANENDGSTKFSETVATEYSANPIVEYVKSDAGISQTSYGQTLFESRDRLTIPSQPKESADGKPFECPYCYFIITVKDRNAWARHIFHDLLPYMCVFPDCAAPGKLFSGRREWFQHIKSKHWSAREDLTQMCPLCQDTLQISQFQRHLGRHLEELALFALPHQEDDEDDEAEENGEKMVSDDISNSSSGIEDDDTHEADTWMDRVRDNLQTTPSTSIDIERRHVHDNFASNTLGGRQPASQSATEFQPPKQTIRDPAFQNLQEDDATPDPSAKSANERWIGKHFFSPRSFRDGTYAPQPPPPDGSEPHIQWQRELDELAEDRAKAERYQDQLTSVQRTVDDLPTSSTPISLSSTEEEFKADRKSSDSQREVSYTQQRRDEADILPDEQGRMERHPEEFALQKSREKRIENPRRRRNVTYRNGRRDYPPEQVKHGRADDDMFVDVIEKPKGADPSPLPLIFVSPAEEPQLQMPYTEQRRDESDISPDEQGRTARHPEEFSAIYVDGRRDYPPKHGEQEIEDDDILGEAIEKTKMTGPVPRIFVSSAEESEDKIKRGAPEAPQE